MEPDPLASLAPLFAAERERRLTSLEQAARRLPAIRGRRERAALLDAMARDAHALKGAALIDVRRELSELVTDFELRLELLRRARPAQAELDALLGALTHIRRLSDAGRGRGEP